MFATALLIASIATAPLPGRTATFDHDRCARESEVALRIRARKARVQRSIEAQLALLAAKLDAAAQRYLPASRAAGLQERMRAQVAFDRDCAQIRAEEAVLKQRAAAARAGLERALDADIAAAVGRVAARMKLDLVLADRIVPGKLRDITELVIDDLDHHPTD